MRWPLAALVALALAPRQAPSEPPPVKPGERLKGPVAEVPEKTGGRILYEEQSGGMVTPLPPVPPGRNAPPPAPPAPAPKAESPAATAKAPPPPPATPAKAAEPMLASPAKPAVAPPPPVAKAPPKAPTAVPREAAAPPTWGDRVDAANDKNDTAALAVLAADPGAKADCDKAYRTWVVARALEEKGDVAGATRLLDTLLACGEPLVRATTLEIARELVEPETFERWVLREAPKERSGEARNRFDRMIIQVSLAQSTASKAPAAERARRLEQQAGEAILRFRDADGASGLGWLWLEAKDPATASLWFSRSQAWAPGDEAGARGLAYAALQERRFDVALETARSLPDGEERRKLERDALVGQAENAFHNDRFAQTVELLARASKSAPLPRYARELEAWSYSRLGQKAEASRRFAELYREAPDKPTAEGLLATAPSQTRIDADLAGTEPLATMLKGGRADAAFNAGRFLEAAWLAPEKYGTAGAVGAPQASLFAGARKRTGESGLSKFEPHTDYGAEASAVVGRGLSLRLRLDRHEMDSGRPTATTVLGSAPATPPPGITFSDTRADIEEGRLTMRYERDVAVNVHVGATTAQGSLPQRVVGGVELEAAPSWGYLAIGAVREPVRESILSYYGMKDPYSDKVWGRVSRDALTARALVLASPWSLGLSGRVARYEGEGVESNRQRNPEISFGYDLGVKGFAYTAASVAFSDDHYEKNLGNYTLGHGGYFSPQRYRRMGAALDFMTAENRQWIVRGRLSAGMLSKRVDEAPYFPLAPDGRVYPGTPTERTHDASGNVAVVARLSSHVQLAAGFSRSISPQYAENQALLQVRILFEPRSSVVSADLPGFIR